MSKWTTTDGRVFDVLRYEGEWVFYRNVATGQEYNCLREAFEQRFFESVE